MRTNPTSRIRAWRGPTLAMVVFWMLCGLARAAEPPDAQTSALNPGDHQRSIIIDGLRRSYHVHVPKSYDASRRFPVVLVFHGGGSNAKQWIPFCGLNETAERAEFIAVYPNGTGKTIQGYDILGWNGGPRRPGGNKPNLDKVDDVGFTKALLDDLATVASLDSKRIYATGMSMGAIMVYRLASELSDRIAAIAPIAGPMGTKTCRPMRAVPVLHFHGMDDEAVPFKGGKGKLDASGTDFYSVDHSIQAWVRANGCKAKPATDELPDVANDGTKAIRKTYGGGNAGAEVILIAIEGGGHTWPGREFGPEMKVLGKSSKDFSANELMWDFFRKHPMQ